MLQPSNVPKATSDWPAPVCNDSHISVWALAALAVDAGAGIIRVHDVAATRDVVAMAQAVRQARQSQLS